MTNPLKNNYKKINIGCLKSFNPRVCADLNCKRDGPWVAYHDNGQLWEKGTYKNGKQHGLWVAYHYYGQVGYKGTFGNGKQHGPWVYFNKDGTVWKSLTGTYKNGVKVN